jgi:hypothetical protein
MDPDDPEGIQMLDTDADHVSVALRLPEGYKFLQDMHHYLNISSSDESVITVPHFDIPDLTFEWPVPVEVHGEGETTLHLEGQVFFCPVTDQIVCIYATLDELYTVRVEEGSEREAVFVIELEIMAELEGARTTYIASVSHCEK